MLPSSNRAAFRRGVLSLFAGAGSLLAGSSVFAQTVPNAGSLLNEQRSTAPSPAAPTKGQEPVLALPEARAAVAPGTVAVTLKAITFSGDTALAAAKQLDGLLQPAIGRTLDHPGLQTLADVVTRQLRARGYAIAYAYLPRQDVTDGTVTITVVGGRLGRGHDAVTVDGKTRIKPSRIAATVLAAARGDAPLRTADLERGMLLVNDLPGMSARATIVPGAAAGTSRLAIDAREAGLIGGELSIDNYGSPSTGMLRSGAGLRLTDPLHIGDEATIAARVTTGSTLVSGYYALPLTASGLRLTLSGSHLDYHVDQARFRALRLTGSAATVTAQLSYPIIRSRQGSLFATAGIEHLALKDNARGQNISNRRVDDVNLGLGATRIGRRGVTEASLTATVGKVDLSRNADQLLVDRLTAAVDGTYGRAAGRLSRTQTLDTAERWTLFAGLSGQVASRNLDSSQKFLAGGPFGVRAYAIGEGIGDQAVLGTIELRRSAQLPTLKASLQFVAFVDGSQVWLNRDPWIGATAGGDNSRGLYAAGIGVNAAGPRWSLRTAMARRIGGDDRQTALLIGTTDTSDWRGWFQAAVRF